jgi:hypothetical protein
LYESSAVTHPHTLGGGVGWAWAWDDPRVSNRCIGSPIQVRVLVWKPTLGQHKFGPSLNNWWWSYCRLWTVTNVILNREGTLVQHWTVGFLCHPRASSPTKLFVVVVPVH